MGILADAPKGFSEAVAAINSLPQGLLVEMVSTSTIGITFLIDAHFVFLCLEPRRHSIPKIPDRIHSH